MILSFILNGGKVLANLKSFGNEFYIVAPRYTKLFCPNFVFNRGGLRFRFELRSVLLVTAEMLLKRLDRLGLRTKNWTLVHCPPSSE